MDESLKVIYEMQANICHALSHPVRLYILDIISQKEFTSTELLEILKIPKANLSQHLSVLKDAGIIKSRKEGPCQYLSLALPKIKDACGLVRSILSEKLLEEDKRLCEVKKELVHQVNLDKKNQKKAGRK